MAAVEDRAKLVKFVHETGSIITTQRRYRREFNKSPPHRNLIRKWVKQFSEVGDVKKERNQEGLRFIINVLTMVQEETLIIFQSTSILILLTASSEIIQKFYQYL